MKQLKSCEAVHTFPMVVDGACVFIANCSAAERHIDVSVTKGHVHRPSAERILCHIYFQVLLLFAMKSTKKYRASPWQPIVSRVWCGGQHFAFAKKRPPAYHPCFLATEHFHFSVGLPNRSERSCYPCALKRESPMLALPSLKLTII